MDETLMVIACVLGIGFLGGMVRSCQLDPEVRLAQSARAHIEECEKTLPRTQTCVLTAVPEKEQKP